MSKIISIHSFRGGTGKSSTTANVAVTLAQKGFRVGVIDTDIQSPGIHILFRMKAQDITLALNDFLRGKCAAHETAYDVTHILANNCDNGTLFLIPSSPKLNEITYILRDGYNPGDLNDGFKDLINSLSLDYLVIDTHPGLNEETLLAIAISDILLLVLRPDSQDYQGTAVTVEVARKLEVENLLLVINKVPSAFVLEEIQNKVERAYNCNVAAIIPHSDDLMVLASNDIFSVKHPEHDLSKRYRALAERLITC